MTPIIIDLGWFLIGITILLLANRMINPPKEDDDDTEGKSNEET